jgi:hypothetical protein
MSLAPNNTAAPINFNATRGIVLGDLDDTKMFLSFLVSNGEVTDKEAAKFQMNFEMQTNMTMKDFTFYPDVQEVNIENVVVKVDHMGLKGDF